MDREQFIARIRTIMHEGAWQQKKGYTIQRSVNNQRRAINAIAKELGLEKLTFDEVNGLGWG